MRVENGGDPSRNVPEIFIVRSKSLKVCLAFWDWSIRLQLSNTFFLNINTQKTESDGCHRCGDPTGAEGNARDPNWCRKAPGPPRLGAGVGVGRLRGDSTI